MSAISCYENWKQENRTILKEFSNKNVLMFYSGGKDSSFALELLLRAGNEFGFGFQVHAGAFPNHRYPEREKERLGSYWGKKGAEIIWHDFQERDEQIRETENPCIICRDIRKALLRRIVGEVKNIDQLVMIISFSLWDLVGYSLEHVLGDIFTGHDRGRGGEKSERFRETAQRFYPFIRLKEGYSIFRPVLKYNGNFILKQIEEMNIPVLAVPCAYKDYRPKRMLEAYYNKIGLSFNYDDVFQFAERVLDLPQRAQYSSIDKERYLKDIF